MKPNDFMHAWKFLNDHKAFVDARGSQLLGQSFVLYSYFVDPKTKRTNWRNEELNTQVKVSMDVLVPKKNKKGFFTGKTFFSEEMNVEGNCFEECVFKLAELVKREDADDDFWLEKLY